MDDDERREEPKVYTAEEVSQGRTVLTTPVRKVVFFGGLVLFVLVVIFLTFHGRG